MVTGHNNLRVMQFYYPNVPRKLVMDRSLSMQARMIYVYMACQEKDFDFLHKTMANDLNVGVDTIKKYIKELVDAGWVIDNGQSFKNGRLGPVDYIINTSPKKTKNKNTAMEKTGNSNLPTAMEKTGNSNFTPLYNINSSINSPINTHISTINSSYIDDDNNNTPSSSPQESDYLSMEEQELKSDDAYQELIAMRYHLTKDGVKDKITDFIIECRCNGMEMHQNSTDLKSHFNNWLKIQQNGNDRKTNKQRQDGESATERLIRVFGGTSSEHVGDTQGEHFKSSPFAD